jgi:hypothetical protein
MTEQLDKKILPTVELVDYDTVVVKTTRIGGGFVRLTFSAFIDTEYLEKNTIQSLWSYIEFVPPNAIVAKTEHARKLIKQDNIKRGEEILATIYDEDKDKPIKVDFVKADAKNIVKTNEASEMNQNTGVFVLRWHPLARKNDLSVAERIQDHDYHWTPYVIPNELGVTESDFDLARDVAYRALLKRFDNGTD